MVFLTLSAILFIGANKWDKEIITESLKVVDKNGSTRIEMSTDVGGGPTIYLYDSEGNSRMGLFIGDGEGMSLISLYDSEGE